MEPPVLGAVVVSSVTLISVFCFCSAFVSDDRFDGLLPSSKLLCAHVYVYIVVNTPSVAEIAKGEA